MARKSVAAVKKQQAQDSEDQEQENQEQVDDSSVMKGGPGSGQQDEVVDDLGDRVSRDSLTEIEVDGTKYKVSKDTAAILEAQQRQFDRTITEVKKTVQPPARKEEKKEPADDKDDIAVRLFSDPKGFIEDFKKQILSEARTTLTAEYTQDQNQKAFWRDFYAEHKDLDPKKDRAIVEAVLRTNANHLYDMETDKASVELANLTRKEILSLMNRHKGVKAGNRTTTLEGASTGSGSSRVATAAAEEESKKRPSLSQIIKQRKDARRRAHLT